MSILIKSIFFNKFEGFDKGLKLDYEDSSYIFETSKGYISIIFSQEDNSFEEFVNFTDNFPLPDIQKDFLKLEGDFNDICIEKIIELEYPICIYNFLIQTNTNKSFYIFTDKDLNDKILFRTYLIILNKSQEKQVLSELNVLREISLPDDWLTD